MYDTDRIIILLQDAAEAFGHTPTVDEYIQSGFKPSWAVYRNRFGSWSNALEKAGLELNQLRCGEKNYEPKYLTGELDVNTCPAKGLIGEITVGIALGLESCELCNLTRRFNYEYDIINDKYGNIDVKTAAMRKYKKYNRWSFNMEHGSDIDNYILLFFNNDRTEIVHVAIIPHDEISDGLTVYESAFERTVGKWLVDANKYNESFSTVNIGNLYEYKNRCKRY